MATLVLGTIGSVLGGPVGSAVGALIGHSIDQELLGAGNRGPRLGDLGLQTSTYGTQVPQIYGTMRVAGSVVWATDLVEGTATTGAKGQPDTTYSYTVSFAVALSSRPIVGIGRIWADGKLIRGADGVFKVPTGFRFWNGSEDQPIDPLIGSVEGVAATPAYRGMALAVFENLDLAEFGNRLPFLTFEVMADPAPPEVGSILDEVTRGRVAVLTDRTVDGYAAYGRSMRSAIEPLVDTFAVRLFDDGSRLRGPTSETPVVLAADALGNGLDGEHGQKVERERMPLRAVPARISITFYDPNREFQTGEAQASTGDLAECEEQHQLPMVLTPGTAKALAQEMLARRWAGTDRLKLRLATRYLTLEPGTRIELPLAPRQWTVEGTTIDGLITIADLRPSWSPVMPIAVMTNIAALSIESPPVEASLALFEVPDFPELRSDESGNLTLVAAVSSPSVSWRSPVLQICAGTQRFSLRAARRKAILGRSLTTLGGGDPFIVDESSSVRVALVDPDHWLTSCDAAALVAGANLAVLGSELFQFGEALPLGDGTFELRRLLRGRRGTEWATGGHSPGENFVLLEWDRVRPIVLPAWARGGRVTGAIENLDGTESRVVETAPRGESLRPPCPVHLRAEHTRDGGVMVEWTRRSRVGWAWLDDVQAPIGESREAYRITVWAGDELLEFESIEPRIMIAGTDLAPLRALPDRVEVRQVGDWAASRPAGFVLH